MRRARWKRKNVRGDLTPPCQITQNGGLAVTHFRPNPEVSYRLRYTQISNQCVHAPESPPPARAANRMLPAPLSAAAPPSSVPLGEGFQRERAAALALCVVGGPGRSRNALVLFFRGVGRVLFQKRMRPTSLRWEPPPPREQEAVKGHPGSAAYSCTGDRPAPGSARRWGWRGCGCPPPPENGW